MALNGKYISLKAILDDLYADNGYQMEIPWEDCIRWTFDALELIGHPSQYLAKVTGYEGNPNLDIKDYRAKLPCGIHKIVQVSVNGVAARYSGNSFHHLLDDGCCGDGSEMNAPNEIYYPNNWPSKMTDPAGFDGGSPVSSDGFSPQLGLQSQTTSNGDVTFDVNDTFLTLSVREGKVCIAYLALPIDDEGFPLIPDNISFLEAVRKYITMKLDYIAWRRDPAGQGSRAIFQHSETEWLWYVGQASNAAKEPDISKMESIKNQIIRMIPETNHFDTFFRNLGREERRKPH